MDITRNVSTIGINRLHEHLIALFPARAAEIVVKGGGLGEFVRVIAPADMDAALTPLVNGYMALAVTATAPVTNAPKTAITANGTDETRIQAAPLIAFDYTIWHGERGESGNFALIELDSTGTAADGVLELSAVDAGVYLVEVKSGNNTGYIEIEATL